MSSVYIYLLRFHGLYILLKELCLPVFFPFLIKLLLLMNDCMLMIFRSSNPFYVLLCLLLMQNGSHNTHFCLPQVSFACLQSYCHPVTVCLVLLLYISTFFQTLEAVKRICPKRALLIGMTHEFDHHKDNEYLMEWSRRYK